MNIEPKINNILVTGGSGFIGSSFIDYASKLNYKTKDFYSKKLNHRVIVPNHKQLDIINTEQLKKTFDLFRPEIIINFAAFRNANTAEEQRGNIHGSVWKTNVKGVENLSKISQEYRSFLIHISTDMVFSGREDNPGPYDENAKPETNLRNLSWYGWTKAEAEQVLTNNKKTAIIRIGNVTQPIYDPRLDYIGKILYLFDHKKLYPLFDDQYLTLSYIPSIFEAIESTIKNKSRGVFHITSKNIFTPYELGEYIIRKTRGKTNVVKSMSIKEYLKKSSNRYPKYGGLLAKKTARQLQMKLLSWKEISDLFIRKMKNIPQRINE